MHMLFNNSVWRKINLAKDDTKSIQTYPNSNHFYPLETRLIHVSEIFFCSYKSVAIERKKFEKLESSNRKLQEEVVRLKLERRRMMNKERNRKRKRKKVLERRQKRRDLIMEQVWFSFKVSSLQWGLVIGPYCYLVYNSLSGDFWALIMRFSLAR